MEVIPLSKGYPLNMPKVEIPTFKDQQYSIVEYGAVGDGFTKNTEAINRAVQDCSEAGGGKVVIPKGLWLTGPIQLKSNVNLHAEKGALVLFSRDFDDYPLVYTSYEGTDTIRCMSPLFGQDLENVAITGDGVFDGSGDAWRPVKQMKMTAKQWKSLVDSGGALNANGKMWWPTEGAMHGASLTKELLAKGEKDPKAFEEARDFLRPTLLQLDRSKRILLDGPTFQNSPSWCLHPWVSEHITIRNVSVRNPWYSQNGDGLDLDSCRYVDVYDCHFDVGDDAICMKSGKDKPGRDLGEACEYINIRDCVVYHGHGGFVIGSEMSGDVKNITISDCLFIGTDAGLRFKTARGRGGIVENIDVRNIHMTDIPGDAITFSMYYSHAGSQNPEVVPVTEETPVFRNFYFENIQCMGANHAININGLQEMPIENMEFVNVNMAAKKAINIRFAKGLSFENVKIDAKEGPLIRIDRSSDIVTTNVTGSHAGEPYAEVMGEGTSNVQFSGEKISDETVRVASEVESSQVKLNNL